MVGDRGDDAEIVRDEQDRETEAAAQAVEQVEHRRLHRDVEGARHLVADEHRRIGRERAGDGYALALAARQLCGEPGGGARRQPHLLEQRPPARAALGAVEPAQHARRANDRLPDAVARVERLERILKIDLDAAPLVARALARVRGEGACRRGWIEPARRVGAGRRCSAPRSSCPSQTRRRARGRIPWLIEQLRSRTATVRLRPLPYVASRPSTASTGAASLGVARGRRAARRARAAACARARGSAPAAALRVSISGGSATVQAGTA